MSFNWFANVLVHQPYIILIGVSVFSGTCLIIPFTLKTLPNFSDPTLGYQTRGTFIANKLATWFNLVEQSKQHGMFTLNPKEFLYRQNLSNILPTKNRKKKPRTKIYGHVRNSSFARKMTRSSSLEGNLDHNWFQLKQLSFNNGEDYFCGMPHPDYSHLVVESIYGDDLFTLDALRSTCLIQQEIMDSSHYEDLCVSRVTSKGCCRPWSLPNYVAFLNNRESCMEITDEDIENTKQLLQNCSHYYHSARITTDCRLSRDACDLPEDCHRDNSVFSILNYITSTSFLSPDRTNDTTLKEMMIFLPIACSTSTLPFYHRIRQKSLSHNGISIVATEFGLKNLLFDEYLMRDTWLLSFGGICVFLCMWVYTGSLFLTIMSIVAIAFSLGFSYFMYTLVFGLNFFPFMNLLTVVIALGIGTDNAFVFCKVWKIMKKSTGGSLVKLMCSTLQHALLSMIITSFTTAAAFFASYISSITAIKCFSIFASVAVMANCLMMMFWFPACIILRERMPQLKLNLLRGYFSKVSVHIPRYLQIQENIIVNCIIKYRYLWFSTLSAVAVCSGVIVLIYPKLQLPTSNEFQLFRNSHPFEKYEMVYKYKFWFSKAAMESAEVNLQLRFVWGVVPQDDGNYLEPLSYGTLKLDENFNMSHPESQTWLAQFCKNLRKQPFYERSFGLLLPNCFIETFQNWMSRKCEDDMENTNHSPCCESETFPFRSWVFDKCIIEAISHLYATPPSYYTNGVAGPKFSKDQMPTIKAIVVEYDSNYTYSLSYEYMDKFITLVDDWFNEEIKTAPSTMRGGFFVTDMDFYDLQRVLSNGTLLAVFVSMGLALIVLFLATLNIITSIFAIINITCSILVTIAVLVLLGWKLNVLESIAISTAIGLAVDFTLHYSVNYKLSSGNLENRLVATRIALSNMLKPVTMAALTTGSVGALMIPSAVMAYIQIGTFLVLVMCVSWFYSTFHLGAMLAIAGPQHNFGQCSHSQLLCNAVNKRKRSKFGAASSTSDTHELDLLTSKPNSVVSVST